MNIVITGMTGSGKSYFARNLLKNIDKPIYSISDNLDDVQELERSLGFEMNLLRIGKNTIIKQIPPDTSIIFENIIYEEMEEIIDYITNYLFEKGNAILYVDEAHLFLPNTNIGKSSKEFERLIRGGRKRGVDIMLVTQRPQDLHLIGISQSHYIITFKSTERNTLKVMSQNMQVDPEKITNLDQYQALIYNTKTGELSTYTF